MMAYLAIGAGVIIFLISSLATMQYNRANSLLKQNSMLSTELVHNQAVVSAFTNAFRESQIKMDYIGEKVNIIHSNSVEQVKVFDKHNLGDLVEKKPELIESLVNKATIKAFKRIEEVTDPNWKP